MDRIQAVCHARQTSMIEGTIISGESLAIFP
jgi:hypothetical protein